MHPSTFYQQRRRCKRKPLPPYHTSGWVRTWYGWREPNGQIWPDTWVTVVGFVVFLFLYGLCGGIEQGTIL